VLGSGEFARVAWCWLLGARPLHGCWVLGSSRGWEGGLVLGECLKWTLGAGCLEPLCGVGHGCWVLGSSRGWEGGLVLGECLGLWVLAAWSQAIGRLCGVSGAWVLAAWSQAIGRLCGVSGAWVLSSGEFARLGGGLGARCCALSVWEAGWKWSGSRLGAGCWGVRSGAWMAWPDLTWVLGAGCWLLAAWSLGAWESAGSLGDWSLRAWGGGWLG
jgi:hypothetical protein